MKKYVYYLCCWFRSFVLVYPGLLKQPIQYQAQQETFQSANQQLYIKAKDNVGNMPTKSIIRYGVTGFPHNLAPLII